MTSIHKSFVSLFTMAAASTLICAACGNPTVPGSDGGNDLAMSLPDMSKTSTVDMRMSLADLGPGGGPISGAQDDHCAAMGDMGPTVQTTSQSSCSPDLLNAPQDGGDMDPDYGDTMYNSSGNDDDCKYFVSFTVMPIYENQDTYFVVKATNTSDGSAVHSAQITPEVYLSDIHPGQTGNSKTVESPIGTYTVGPIRFDASGMWTIRFHLFEQCADLLPDSPHGHAAFYLNVP